MLIEELRSKETLAAALDAYMARRYERCRFIVDGSEAIGRWGRTTRCRSTRRRSAKRS